MVHLSLEKRFRAIYLYLKHNLRFVKGRFDVLNEYAKAEDIFTSTKTLKKWVNRWLNEGTISNKISVERRLKHIKITTDDLLRLDRAVFKKRDLSARLAKTKLNLEMSSRSIQRYLNKMGWKKIRTRRCAAVNEKNRIERIIFAKLCIDLGERFDNSIFLDECTVSMDKNGKTQWYRKFPGETRLGFKGQYKHTQSVHIIGGISRRGATKLMIFTGN
jgi:hypothetical protein